MVRKKEGALAELLSEQLSQFDSEVHELPGIALTEQRNSFIEQLIESIRRVQFVSVISERNLHESRSNPLSENFNPLKAAIIWKRKNCIDEAFWMVFLFVCFGKNKKTGWRLARDIYGALGTGTCWNWKRITSDFASFRTWFTDNQEILNGGDGIKRSFGNHRKFESLKISAPKNLIRVFESYIDWVNPPRTHQELIEHALEESGRDSKLTFDELYNSMNSVVSFGRMARFDYLTMIGKLDLASIRPGYIYFQGSTGPHSGANLLFTNQKSSDLRLSELEELLIKLEANLDIGEFGMQVLEDALCNWQKSPNEFKPFRL